MDLKKRFSEEQIIGLLRQAEARVPVKELRRQHGFSDASFYTWRARFGGMAVRDAKRLKDLEAENAQLQARPIELASERRRFGYRRLQALVRRDGVHAN